MPTRMPTPSTAAGFAVLSLLLSPITSPAATAPAADVKSRIDAWQAAFNSHDLERVTALYAPNATIAGIDAKGWTVGRGPAAVTKNLEPYFKAFPDVRLAPTRVFHQGELAIVEWVADGTNKGSLNGAPPTGKRAGISGITFLTFDKKGLITRSEAAFDPVTLAQQVGLAPGPARAIPAWPSEPAVWVEAGTAAESAKIVKAAKATWPATWNKRDTKAYDAVLADDSVHIELAGPNDFKGRAANLAELEMYVKALPDMHAEVEKGWGFGEYAVLKFTFRGTMKGPIGPFKATNKPIVIHAVDVDLIRDGKMITGVTYSNAVELLTHLGVMPPK